MKPIPIIRDAIDPTPERFHDCVLHTLEHLPALPQRKKQHIPARKAILLAALLICLLGSSAAGARYIDLSWFKTNRSPFIYEEQKTESRSVCSLSYNGRMLESQVTEAEWNREQLQLSFTYTLTGLNPDALTVHSGCLGVDGLHFDRIWTDEGSIPIEKWSNGKPVHIFYLDGWTVADSILPGSGDYVTDGLGESFYETLNFCQFSPETYAHLPDADGMITLTCRVWLKDHQSGATLEEGTLTFCVSAPQPAEWRAAYEAYTRIH